MKPVELLSVFFALMLLLYGADTADAGAGFASYRQGDSDSPKIAITVDDLFGLDHLESILDLCQTYDIKMTFFAIGMVILPEDAAVWQRIIDEGHEIGNHTYYHNNISESTIYQLERQLIRTQEALNSVLQEPYTMYLFRPPYGEYNRNGRGSVEALGPNGYPYLILWSVDTTDPDTAFRKTTNGSILLFHTNLKDVKCLEVLIPRLLEAGYEPVTVSELLNLPLMEDEVTSE